MKKSPRIARVRAHEVVVPARPGVVDSPLLARVYEDDAMMKHWDRLPICVIEIETDDGLIGLGETTRGVTLETLKPWLAKLPGITIQGWSLGSLPREWRGTTLHNLYAKQPPPLWTSPSPLIFALEMAFLDLAGRRAGCRVVDLLGGACRETVPVHYWGSRQTPEDLAATVRKAKALGFHGIKIKLRLGDPVVEQIAAIHSAAGKDFQVTIDPMFQWVSPVDALPLFRQLEALGGHLQIEDPFPQDMPEFWQRARGVSAIPLMWHARTQASMRAGLQAGCVDGFNCSGGIIEFLASAHAVEVAGSCCWHGSAIEMGIGQVAHLHAAAAARSCVLYSDFVSGFIREHTLITWDWPYRESHLPLPGGAGLGVELDRNAVEKYKKAGAEF